MPYDSKPMDKPSRKPGMELLIGIGKSKKPPVDHEEPDGDEGGDEGEMSEHRMELFKNLAEALQNAHDEASVDAGLEALDSLIQSC